MFPPSLGKRKYREWKDRYFFRFRESKSSYTTLYSNVISFSQSLSSLPKDTIFYSVSITQIVSQQSGYNIRDIWIGKQRIDYSFYLSLFLNNHYKSKCHTKFHCCNSFFWFIKDFLKYY